MSDTLGRITIPTPAPTLTWPLRTDFSHGRARKRNVIVHQFGNLSGKVEQRFHVGPAATRYTFARRTLSNAERATLRAFWDGQLGPAGVFYYPAPQDDQSFVTKTVCFEDAPLTIDDLTNSICSVGVTFVEVPDPAAAPVYSIASTVTRFPGTALADALLDQVQDIAPLVRIRVADAAVPDIYLADRRVTLTGAGTLSAPGTVTPTPSTTGGTLAAGTYYGKVTAVNANGETLGSPEFTATTTGTTGSVALAWAAVAGAASYRVYWGTAAGAESSYFAAPGNSYTVTVTAGTAATVPVSNTTGTLVYLPRLLRVGEPGSGVLISQSIDGASDNVQFAFGNADRAMIQCANDTDLFKARIELSLFHVGSGIKLDLWAGEIIGWHSDAGPEFVMDASDIISSQNLQSPVRNISRTCFRVYGDASTGCTVAIGTDTRDLTHFPSADMASCDRSYDAGNGCLAHVAAKRSFPGCIAAPQQVRITDNSTGGPFGFGRDLVTPTSQINDSIWGGSLPEIWHNDDGIAVRGLPVTCRIASARDESDFLIALGIVGRGPISAFSTAQMVDANGDGIKETFVGSTLDGQPHHGFKKTNSAGDSTDSGLGLRQVLGTDPAGASDWFSLGRVGSSTTSWREITNGTSVYEEDYAAGICFVEIRRTNQKGGQPSSPSSHVMIAMISQGLTALSWTAPGARGTIAGCTNVFWVAVNTFLRSLGVDGGTAAAQEGYFDVAAAISCASTADATVNALIGGGTEAQFRFKGTIDDRRPLRDRLQEVLNNGLGYFTWSFGRLKLGVRASADPATTFSAANMLFGSLRLEPIRPQFEKLTLEFADTEYLFAKNTVDYTDLDYAQRNGRIQNPRASQLGLIGSSTKSQSLRIATIRTREELGGVGAAEQTAARMASWRSTIMALDTEAGQVAAVIDPDIPGGAGRFRIQRWTLNRDWSIDLVGRTVTDSMYDLTTGFVPAATAEAAKAQTVVPRDSNAPPSPVFSARVAADDPTTVELYGLSLTSTVDIRTISAGTFTAFYYDPSIAAPTLSAGITNTATSVTLSSATGISAGTYLLIESEIVLCGAPSGLTVPITRAQLGTTAAAHSTVAAAILSSKAFGAVWPPDFFASGALAAWTLRMYLPGMTVAAISGYVTNAYGNSPAYQLPLSLVLAKAPLLAAGAPATTGQTLVYNGTAWVPTTVGGGATWDIVTPTGTLDGTNKIFTVPHTPVGVFMLYLAGVLQHAANYSRSGVTITFTVAPKARDAGYMTAIYTY